MRDVYDHNPDDHDDPAAAPTWTIGIVSVILLVATVLFVAALFFFVYNAEVEEKYIRQTYQDLEQLIEEQREQLSVGPRVELRPENAETDEPRSIVIPIDRAMDLIIEEGLASQQ
jgi:hypothetical protein